MPKAPPDVLDRERQNHFGDAYNRAGALATRGKWGKYYCGREGILTCSCCHGQTCGPFTGCNCLDCQALELKMYGGVINRDGALCRVGAQGHHYCAMPVLHCGCCNGNCGPDSGCNCAACYEIDHTWGLPPAPAMMERQHDFVARSRYQRQRRCEARDRARPLTDPARIRSFHEAAGFPAEQAAPTDPERHVRACRERAARNPRPRPTSMMTPPRPGGLFGQAAPSFGAPPQPAQTLPTFGFGGTASNRPPTFGMPAPAPAPTGGLFGSGNPSISFSNPPSFGSFGNSNPPSGFGFGNSNRPPGFGNPSMPSFGNPPAVPPGGFFGQSQPRPSGGLFGQPQPASTSAAPSFSFGQPQPAAAPAPSFSFGQPQPATTAPSFSFGQPQPAAAPAQSFSFGQPGLFGRQQPPVRPHISPWAAAVSGAARPQPALIPPSTGLVAVPSTITRAHSPTRRASPPRLFGRASSPPRAAPNCGFGQPRPASPPRALFGNARLQSPPRALFGASSPPRALFGNPSSSSPPRAAPAPLFGNCGFGQPRPASPPRALFGGNAAPPQSPPRALFGAAGARPSSPCAFFGNPSGPRPSSPPRALFGNASPQSPPRGLFGNPSGPRPSSPPRALFGTPSGAPPQSPPRGLFGNPSGPRLSSPPRALFGNPSGASPSSVQQMQQQHLQLLLQHDLRQQQQQQEPPQRIGQLRPFVLLPSADGGPPVLAGGSLTCTPITASSGPGCAQNAPRGFPFSGSMAAAHPTPAHEAALPAGFFQSGGSSSPPAFLVPPGMRGPPQPMPPSMGVPNRI
ncbi:hypothetical protein PAPYR_2294 [Paratrimastix pyriformis]|uniref:Uncharacterized protein n=1 Tax=Paratrimastix pyriformis TaxID=342808 RepID=A0ABQ8UQ11_9EUKA|nr:hypothetical protein PAPYR_2294 [Paratrimastix pyriformis]